MKNGLEAVRISESCDDPAWDRFLQQTRCGRYQQSGMWARAKSYEGWQPLRLTYLRRGEIAGGFQLLHKNSRGARIGYISKGPVIGDNDPDLWETAVQDIAGTGREKKLHALIVQQPDAAPGEASLWPERLFVREGLLKIITSTLLFDIRGDMASFERSIHPDYMRKVRQARRRGVAIREGSRGDLDLFFDLMLMSCRRQGEEHPRPATAEALRAIWDAFAEDRCIRLTLAEVENTAVAGQLNIIFGKRVTLYKKGWTSERVECRPNHLLTHEALDWAHREGVTTVDSLALNRGMAETLLAGKPLSKAHTQSRDMFNLCFGGRPQLLPNPYILIPNSLLRVAYKAAAAFPALGKILNKVI